MNKQALLRLIVAQLKEGRDALVRAANAAHEEATHEESTAENKYDTRGLEASYLAEAQSRRVAEVEKTIHLFESMKPRTFGESDAISIGAVVALLDEREQSQWFFLASRAGGHKVEMEGKTLSILNPQSPLGRQLMGSYLGDWVELRIRNKVTEFEIVSVA